jgi:hypothetical protein
VASCANVLRRRRAGMFAYLTQTDASLTTGVKLQGPEGAERLRALSASTSELACDVRLICHPVGADSVSCVTALVGLNARLVSSRLKHLPQ